MVFGIGGKKCSGCGKKIESKFSFCPFCGFSLKKQDEEDDFGLLGKDDEIFNENEFFGNSLFSSGFDKLVNGLMKQLEKQMNTGAGGFNIKISTGNPKIEPVKEVDVLEKPKKQEKISSEEIARRIKLPREEAETKNVRRLSDRVVYEISLPGVKNEKDLIIVKLENSIEIKAYSKNKCWQKIIPVTMQIISWKLKDEVLSLELKS